MSIHSGCMSKLARSLQQMSQSIRHLPRSMEQNPTGLHRRHTQKLPRSISHASPEEDLPKETLPKEETAEGKAEPSPTHGHSLEAHEGESATKGKHGGAHGVLEEEEEEGLSEHHLAHYVVVPVGLAIVSSLFAGGILHSFHISWLPESAVTLGLGVVLGLYMKSQIGHHSLFKHEDVFSHTSSTLLTLFLLPLLIFEPGWCMRVKDFASQFWYIIIYAVIGSLISFVSVGCAILWTGQHGLHSITMPRTAFAYASLIAATDPVATLGTFSKLKVDPLLNTLVMGDSIFNDAVAITLFKVLNNNEIMGGPDSRPELGDLAKKILAGIGSIFLGSVGIGFCIAALFLLLLRFAKLQENPRVEILAIVCIAYVNFAVAEVLHYSGIIATIFCSIVLGIYARPHLSKEGSLLGDFFIKQMACVMDTLVFLLTGFAVVMLDTQGFKFGGWVMLFCLVSRAIAVFPMTGVINGIKRGNFAARDTPEAERNYVSKEHMFMIWHAGLRGAIALTLCMQLGPWVDALDGPGTRHILQTATYFLICVFLLVFGGSTEIMLKYLGIPMGEKTAPDKLYKSEMPQAIQNTWSALDKHVFVPLFVGSAEMAEKITEEDKELEVEEVLKSALKAK